MKFKIDEGFAKFFWDALLCLALYLLCVGIPCFIPDVTQKVFTGVARFIFLIPILWLLLRNGLRPHMPGVKYFMISLPLAVICLGNMMSLWTSGEASSPNVETLLLDLAFTFGTALIEEAVFRFGMLEALRRTSWRKLSIPLSALLFGAFHLFALLSGSAVGPTFAQAGYTFLLGLILGVAYLYGGFLSAFVIHLAFNFLSSDLYLSCGGWAWDLPFFLWNIGFTVLAFGYAALLFFRRIIRQENYFRPNMTEPENIEQQGDNL